MIYCVLLLNTAGMPVRVIPSPWKPQVVILLNQAALVAVAWCLLTAGLDRALISWVSLVPLPPWFQIHAAALL
jgi:hypothetical protein